MGNRRVSISHSRCSIFSSSPMECPLCHAKVPAWVRHECSTHEAPRRSSLVRENALADPNYSPYCLRCSTMARMRKVEHMLWRCSKCGAVHDEREAD